MRLTASEELKKEIEEELKLVDNLDNSHYTIAELIDKSNKESLDSIDDKEDNDEDKDSK